MKNNLYIIGIIFIIAVALAVLINNNHLLSISQINGGTILGVSYLQFFSNFNQLNGVPAYLVNLVINNGGESLQGTINNYSSSTGSLTNNINNYAGTTYQVNNPNQQINIDTKLNSLSLNIPYDYAGYHLYKYYNSFKYLSYTLPNAPLGLTCNSGERNNQIFVGCSDYSGGVSTLAPTVSSFVQTLANDCQNQYTDAILTVSNASTGTAEAFGLNIVSALYYNVTCNQPYLGEIGLVMNPSTANYNYNVSIYFSNSTFTKTLYLSNQNPQTNYNNILFAQIYGLQTTGQGISSVTSAPQLIEFLNQTYIFVNPFSTATGLGQVYTQYTPAYEPITASNLNLVPYGIDNGAYVIQNAYSLTQLTGQIYNQNLQIEDLLTPLQQSNPYANIQYNKYSGNATLNVINNPPVYPLAQLIAKVSTLGVYQAITEPEIISVSPNQITFTDGSVATLNINVQNQQNVAGSFYGNGYCGQTTFTIPNTNIGGNSQTSVSILLQSPVNSNPNLKEYVKCQATVHSSFGIYSSIYNFSGLVNPECSAGSVYQNSTTCQNQFNGGNGTTNGTTSCNQGYELQGNTCVPIPPKCNTNETANYSTFPPHCNSPNSTTTGIGIGWYVLVAGIIIAIAIIFGLKKNNRIRSRYR